MNKTIHNIKDILNKDAFTKNDLVALLSSDEEERQVLFAKAGETRNKYVGNKVYYRGLIEFSNICSKNCYYCGIRSGNKDIERYELTDTEIIDGAMYAHDNKFGSIVLQAGERSDKSFVERIDKLIQRIKQLSNGELGITLSLGEQTEETFRRWFESGAHRYLLRIEVSNPALYPNYHPGNQKHNYNKRLENLELLKKIGYQTGSGVMIGLPFQTLDDLADDLLFLKEQDVDMAGMGPYIEHINTPMYQYKDRLISREDRFYLSLKMVACLRLLMKDINIAATTAMQTLDPTGREKAIRAGANIIMPNITPTKYRKNYLLYEDKPCLDENAADCKKCLETRINLAGSEIGYGQWGDSKHYFNRINSDRCNAET